MRPSKAILPGTSLAILCAALASGVAAQTPPGSTPTGPAPDKAGFVWVKIPGGEFEMGSAAGDGDEKPPHKVRVREFSLAKNPVTQAQWLAVMGTRPSLQKDCDDCPVTNVTWEDAQQFLKKAGALTGEALRLPTEAEWEYAAGGGAEHQKWAGTSNPGELGNYAWYSSNSARRVHPVCQKQPNLFGLCDMTGNVWEWCSDWYQSDAYATAPAENPTGPAAGEDRVLRGGCWASTQPITRVTQRYHSWPGASTPYNGLRPAKE